NLIIHTSIFIQKILTLKDWNQPAHSHRQFSGSYIPSIYNYFDYIDAWRHTFLFQNVENRHSGFFCFDKTFNIDQTIQLWFVDWWLREVFSRFSNLGIGVSA
ncbi:hypothetical protein CFOL_v3_35736, partial [Cephalotus follicularis]